MASSHSTILGGSNAARLLACPASYLETQRAPLRDTSSEYADEGTFLHTVITHFVLKKITPQAAREWDWARLAKFELSDEQREALATALEQLEMLKEKYAGAKPWKIVALEKLLPLPGVLGAFGSVDLVLANDVCVLVLDWKFGQGVPVFAVYDLPNGEQTINPQVVFYACAARGHGKFKRYFKGRRIVLAIVQPRLVPPSSHVETDDEELDGFLKAFENAVIEALDRNAYRERGEHCRFASCKATCPYWTGPLIDMMAINPSAAALEASVIDEPTEYGAFLSKAMDLAETAEVWATEVRRQAHVFLEDGGLIRDWKLVPKRGTRQWVDDEGNTVAALRGIGALDTDIYTQPELRSVAGVEKALKPKKITMPTTLYQTVSSGTTIARSDDQRPESTHATVLVEFRQALKAL